MPFIAPQDRFSRHANSQNCDPDTLRKAVSQYGRPPERCRFERLAGGFMNANYQVSLDGEKFLLRVYSTDTDTANRECDLLAFLSTRPVRVPKVLASFQVDNRPVAILEFVDGITLEDRLMRRKSVASTLYAEMGAQLAEIHRITFPNSGFIGPRLEIVREDDDFSTFLRQFIERTLSMLLQRQDRLSETLNRRLTDLVHDKWHIVSATEPRRQLVHCDFNPKNLLVSEGPSSELLAVIDWEFCMSGNGLADLGNFFRFEYDYPATARTDFAAGYVSVSADLPADWIDVSKLLDIGNMCSFLERPENYQESFRTARTVILSTLEHFGY